MSLETREIKLFGQDIPGFCWDIPAVPEKFEEKRFVFNLWPLCFAASTGVSLIGRHYPGPFSMTTKEMKTPLSWHFWNPRWLKVA